MPILTETSEPKKRRAPVWALVLLLALLPPMGLFAWGWYRSVSVSIGGHWVLVGRVPEDLSFYLAMMSIKGRSPGAGGNSRGFFWSVKLPDGDWYLAGWYPAPVN